MMTDGVGERATGGMAGPAVLVVDDDSSNLTAMCGLLSDLGAEVVAADSGADALRRVLRRDFCAILMDVRMPQMDGYETAALIRQRERSRHIPIIFLTAYDKDEAQVFRGYSEGGVDYVFKPVKPVVLRAKVRVFIELYRQAEQERLLLEENFRIRNDHMKTERQLRSTERREAMVFRQLPIAVYEVKTAGHGAVRSFLHDDSVKRLLGFTVADFEKDVSLWSERVHPEDWETARGALAKRETDGAYSAEYRWRCGDDTYRYFLDQGLVVAGEDGGPSRIFGTMFDVHSRRMLQQQLLHAQKIDAIGKLTGGIAHDFNNMLTVVIGNLDRLQRTEGLDIRAARRVDHALQGALHCRDITQRLLGLARQEGRPLRPLDLNALISHLSDLVTRTLGERIEIKKKLQVDLWQIYSDADQIESALLNLLVNARDAMPDGGTVSIRTANVRSGSGAAVIARELADGDYVVLEVADTGAGMTSDVLERARDAFFTTKGAGKGTGLGLSTIHDFTKRLGGDLAIESSPGKGTTVRIYLPRQDSNACSSAGSTEEGRSAELPVVGGGEVVLVVEDEEPVRRVTATTLRELGYRVLEAATATAALDALEQAREVRLLFTDIVMPG
ncbi:MAG TPA: response regulator, partial [Nocardioides sp.]